MELSVAYGPRPRPTVRTEETQVIRVAPRDGSALVRQAAQTYVDTLLHAGCQLDLEGLRAVAIRMTCQAVLQAAGGGDAPRLLGSHETLDLTFSASIAALNRMVENSLDKPRLLGETYERLAALSLVLDPRQRPIFRPVRNSARRVKSSFYTPVELIDSLLERSLEPAIKEWGGDPTGKAVLDPACGAGFFLLHSLRMMRTEMPEIPVKLLLRVLQGIDIDPFAAELARAALWLELRGGLNLADLDGIIEVGDAMRKPLLPELLARRFDLVIGNPPFQNAIERAEPHNVEFAYRLGGTADLAYEFLNLGAHLCKPGGRVAMVQPKSFLGSRSAHRLRADPASGLRPNFIGLPTRSNLFEKTVVYICLLVLGPQSRCDIEGPTGDRVAGIIQGSNWWEAAMRLLSGVDQITPSGQRVEEMFEVTSSMTTGEAYRLRPFIQENAVVGQRLITTGLIGQGECFWGEKRCRYLMARFKTPVVAEDRNLPPSIQTRLHKSRRPKLLIGGLGRRIKCFFDEDGERLGAVSTYSIYHPQNDRLALATLQARLLSPEAHRLFHLKLGSNALGGGSLTMTKQFLRDFPFCDSDPMVTT